MKFPLFRSFISFIFLPYIAFTFELPNRNYFSASYTIIITKAENKIENASATQNTI